MGKTLPWKTKLAILRQFKEAEGHTLVRQGYVDPKSGFRLGRWVANLRQRQDFLSESQREDLENLDFVWSRFKVLPWNTKLDILRQFKAEHGHTLVPKEYVDKQTGFHLGWWVDRMRQTRSTMNKARVQDLLSLDFVWNAFDAHWHSMFLLLKEYKSIYHHASPKVNSEFRGRPLGHWTSMQRQLRSRRQRQESEGVASSGTVISDDRIAMLDSIGFVWRLRTSGMAELDDISCITAATDELSTGASHTSSPIRSPEPSPLLTQMASQQAAFLSAHFPPNPFSPATATPFPGTTTTPFPATTPPNDITPNDITPLEPAMGSTPSPTLGATSANVGEQQLNMIQLL